MTSKPWKDFIADLSDEELRQAFEILLEFNSRRMCDSIAKYLAEVR